VRSFDWLSPSSSLSVPFCCPCRSGRLNFEDLGKIAVKGKKNPVAIFHPYPKNIAHFFQRPKKKGEDDGHTHGTSSDGSALIVGAGKLRAVGSLSETALRKLGIGGAGPKKGGKDAAEAKEETKKEESGPPKGMMLSVHDQQLLCYAEKHFNALKPIGARSAAKGGRAQGRGSIQVNSTPPRLSESTGPPDHTHEC
jgi:hypothetical protein